MDPQPALKNKRQGFLKGAKEASYGSAKDVRFLFPKPAFKGTDGYRRPTTTADVGVPQ